MKYRLTRITPKGREIVMGDHVDLRHACAEAMWFIITATNDRNSAQRFASWMGCQPVGTAVDHLRTGYAFRADIVEA